MLHTRPETFGRNHSLVAHRRQIVSQLKAATRISQKLPESTRSYQKLPESVRSQWPGRATGQKRPGRVGSGWVTGQRFRPGSISVWGSAVSSPAGFGRSPDSPTVFHYFQHSGSSLLTLICGTSCSHWGGARPRAPLPLRAPLHIRLSINVL